MSTGEETLTFTGKPGFSKRVAACLKACESVSTETLERIGSEGGLAVWEQMEQTNADLLAALKWIDIYISNQPLDSLAQFLITKKVRDTIEGTKEGA